MVNEYIKSSKATQKTNAAMLAGFDIGTTSKIKEVKISEVPKINESDKGMELDGKRICVQDSADKSLKDALSFLGNSKFENCQFSFSVQTWKKCTSFLIN